MQEVGLRTAASSTFLTDIVETNESEPPGMMSHIPESFFSRYDSLIYESFQNHPIRPNRRLVQTPTTDLSLRNCVKYDVIITSSH